MEGGGRKEVEGRVSARRLLSSPLHDHVPRVTARRELVELWPRQPRRAEQVRVPAGNLINQLMIGASSPTGVRTTRPAEGGGVRTATCRAHTLPWRQRRRMRRFAASAALLRARAASATPLALCGRRPARARPPVDRSSPCEVSPLRVRRVRIERFSRLERQQEAAGRVAQPRVHQSSAL